MDGKDADTISRSPDTHKKTKKERQKGEKREEESEEGAHCCLQAKEREIKKERERRERERDGRRETFLGRKSERRETRETDIPQELTVICKRNRKRGRGKRERDRERRERREKREERREKREERRERRERETRREGAVEGAEQRKHTHKHTRTHTRRYEMETYHKELPDVDWCRARLLTVDAAPALCGHSRESEKR
jgi:hypothetical protein